LKQISRREFLQIAGGVTFLALVPNGRGLFAAAAPENNLPLFSVLPYIQPGSASVLKENADTLVVAWQTENQAADFTVSYGSSKKYGQNAVITKGERTIDDPAQGEVPHQRLNYSAELTGLKLGRKYYYRVSGNGRVIAEGYATTRQPRGRKIRFVTFGDNSYGGVSDHRIAYQAYMAKPDFIMNTGDNVYQSGLDHEYAKFFFPVYDATVAGLELGAPLLRSVPFYTVLANHDVPGRDAQGREAGDFTKHSDALGYYTAMHLPRNGPATLASPTPTVCADPAILQQFQECAGNRFPQMANYSFDNGDAHFLCLDANTYVDPTDKALQDWIEQDLAGTDARWKFVVYHQPAFNVGKEHYKEQQMRVLCPIFEKHGVDIVLNGHEHTYQRTMPIKFTPIDLTRATHTNTRDRIIPGQLTIDREFNGKDKTRPNGVIHLTTGAGGNIMYEPDFTDSPDRWVFTDGDENHYVAKFHSEKHSLTVIEIDGRSLMLRQISEFGDEIDRIHVTK
jgi:hypothetical protein